MTWLDIYIYNINYQLYIFRLIFGINLPNTIIVPHKKMQNCTNPINGVSALASLKYEVYHDYLYVG